VRPRALIGLIAAPLCAWPAPGSVVVVRHSYAPGSFDSPDARLEDCSTQRNLDVE